MKTKTSLLIACVAVLFLSNCNNARINNVNPIFEKFSPDKKEYKDELAKELKSPEAKEFTFVFNNYISTNGKEYLDVDVIGHELYAKAFVLVKNWNKLEGIKRTKGAGYHGAELRGLVIDVEKLPESTELVYRDVKEIMD